MCHICHVNYDTKKNEDWNNYIIAGKIAIKESNIQI
jgi:hypothetical protein